MRQQQELGRLDPLGGAFDPDSLVETDTQLFLRVVVKHGINRDERRHGLRRVTRLSQVNAPRAAPLRQRHVVAQRRATRRAVRCQVVECRIHLQHALALGEVVRVGHASSRIRQRFPDTVGRVEQFLCFQRRQQQRDPATSIRRRHRSAVHQHVAAERPARNRGERAARRRDVHAQIAVARRAAGTPGIQFLVARGAERIGVLHQVWRDDRTHAENGRGRAAR